MTLAARLLALILVAIVPSIAIMLYNEHVLRTAREEELRREAFFYAKAATDELERVIEGVRGFMRVVVQAPPIRDRDWNACARHLSQLAGVHPGYARLAVVDPAGRIVCTSAPDLSDVSVDRVHFRRALAGADFTVGGLLTSPSRNIQILPFASPLRDEAGRIDAVFLAGLRIDWLVAQLEQKEHQAGRTLLIADRHGTILARSPVAEPRAGAEIGPSWRPLSQSGAPGTADAVDVDGVHRVYGYVPPDASLAQLFVAGGISTAQAMRDIEAASRRGLIMAGLAGLAALILTWLVAERLIRRPVGRLVRLAHGIGMGEYDCKGPKQSGEFGTLNHALADAAAKLARREAQLRDSELRFHRLADLTREAIAIHDGERIIDANAVAAVMFGYEPDEVIGRPVMGFIAPEARDGVKARVGAGSEGPYESTGVRKDGSRFPVEVCARPIDYDGRTVRVIVVHDLTSRNRAEQALREAEERYRLAARATRDLIWDWDIATGTIHLNETAFSAYGYDGTETIKFDWWVDKLHPADRPRVAGALEDAIKGEGDSWSAEYCLRRADGSWANVLDRGLIVRRPDGQAVRMIGAVMDLSERKRMEAALQRVADRNQALLREADHRIKNNLQLVSSMLGLQRSSLHDAEARQAFQEARRRIQAIARVHQALYSSGNSERADFTEVLCSLRDSLMTHGRDNPEIVVDARAGCMIAAAKATPLALIANELATNALKHAFMPGQPGKVTLSCGRDADGDFVLTVRDDGKGLPPGFDPAEAGFGLRLVHTLARQVGGRVAVRGRDGPGTTMEVRVPSAAM